MFTRIDAMRILTEVLAVILAISSVFTISSAINNINADGVMKDGETIVSSDGSFELGFFSPGNSTNRYLGLWFKKISLKTVVWVANRQIPVNSTSGVLKLTTSGVLNILSNTNDLTPIWSSSNTSRNVQDPVAELLNNGNFVIRQKNDNNPDNFLWQSFDHPTDTLLSGMKLGKNFITGKETFLSSWKSSDDPAPGEFTYSLDPTGYPHNIIRKGGNLTFQTGAWNGLRFSGRPKSNGNTIYTHKVVINKEEAYYMFELINTSITRLVINPSGKGQRTVWLQQTQNWKLQYEVPADNCDTYKLCGPYGSCNINNGPVCGCLEKFEPIDGVSWGEADWSKGCTSKKPLDCQEGDGFRKYFNVKVPDTLLALSNESLNLKECGKACLKNCSCKAYTTLNITNGGRGCLQWFGDLVDIRDVSGGGQDLYVRVAFSDSDVKLEPSGKKKTILIVSLSISGGIVLLGLSLAVCICRKKKKRRVLLKRSEDTPRSISMQEYSSKSHEDDLELPFFRLSTLAAATNNFSPRNKLGQGGFGPVFRGILEDGQEIAVKCLSQTSRQGTSEFMNEVKSIAKLQHRNLVRLLGYCIQGEKRMLIYEYMPNKSLDWHIFDESRNKLLDWPQRFHIIDGIARGLLYLHQDSRLRIIHRDLKASNILLDINMNPKISDFGTARSFMENETTANTNQIVGTFGYMSPEYAVDGLFSVKSDVFSFGVLVLEIVCGSRNRGFVHRDHLHNLLGHAWSLHKEGRAMELILQNRSHDALYTPEMLRAIHIGLLCVQHSPEDRPNMSSVVLMLGSRGELPMPLQPGFFTERYIVESEYFDTENVEYSTDATTSSSMLQGR